MRSHELHIWLRQGVLSDKNNPRALGVRLVNGDQTAHWVVKVGRALGVPEAEALRPDNVSRFAFERGWVHGKYTPPEYALLPVGTIGSIGNDVIRVSQDALGVSEQERPRLFCWRHPRNVSLIEPCNNCGSLVCHACAIKTEKLTLCGLYAFKGFLAGLEELRRGLVINKMDEWLGEYLTGTDMLQGSSG